MVVSADESKRVKIRRDSERVMGVGDKAMRNDVVSGRPTEGSRWWRDA